MANLRPPPYGDHLQLEFPSPKVMVLALNRPNQLNSMNDSLQADICSCMDWFESEPSLWVVIITGRGRFFCAGQDLKGWLAASSASAAGKREEDPSEKLTQNPHGFGSLSRRISTKPIILALNGSALGGGAEILANSDLVVAPEGAKIGFPEVTRAVMAGQGSIPLLSHSIPHPRASQIFLLGDPITAQEALKWGLINAVVDNSQVMPTALAWAQRVVDNCPESVQLTKRALNASRNGYGLEESIEALAHSGHYVALMTSQNHLEGLKAFSEKRKPIWTDPKPLKKGILSTWPLRLRRSRNSKL